MASKSCRGELKRPNPLKADVAETHWGSNVNSPWQANFAMASL